MALVNAPNEQYGETSFRHMRIGAIIAKAIIVKKFS
jgi:hypothetical protein